MFWCHGKQSGQQNSVNCLKRNGATTLTIFVQNLGDFDQLKLIAIFMYMRVFLELKIIDMLRFILLHWFSKVTLPQRVLIFEVTECLCYIIYHTVLSKKSGCHQKMYLKNNQVQVFLQGRK